MTRGKKGTDPLRLRGSPHRLATLVPELQDVDPRKLAAELSVGSSKAPTPVPVFVRRTGELRLDLPRDTPPGTYAGVVRVGDSERPVEVEVAPRVHLRLYPKRLELEGYPGEEIAVELTLTNQGNAPAEIGRSYSIGLVDVDGFDDVLGRLLAHELRDESLEHFVDQVTEEHAALMDLKIARGFGRALPGEVREVHVTCVLPSALSASRTYSGTWRLHNLHYPIRVTATGEPPARRSR